MAERDAFVAFVRAVMIGREGLHRSVLLDMFERAGATDAVSYITTGNVSFTCPPELLDDVVETVERDLERLLDRPTPLFVRTPGELVALLDRDPFADEPFEDVVHREVTLVRNRVPGDLDLPVESPKGTWSIFAADARHVFSVQRMVDGTTQSPGGAIERLVGEPVTTRAPGTLERIVAKLGAAS